jgi:hypothetical protein
MSTDDHIITLTVMGKPRHIAAGDFDRAATELAAASAKECKRAIAGDGSIGTASVLSLIGCWLREVSEGKEGAA